VPDWEADGKAQRAIQDAQARNQAVLQQSMSHHEPQEAFRSSDAHFPEALETQGHQDSMTQAVVYASKAWEVK
jgi:hypothetical protein